MIKSYQKKTFEVTNISWENHEIFVQQQFRFHKIKMEAGKMDWKKKIFSWIFISHTDKYYSKNLNLGPEEMPVDKNPVGSTVFHADFIASVADTARICYLK